MKTKTAPARADRKESQDVNSGDASNQPTSPAESYWTLWRRADDTELRKAWNIPPRKRPMLLHEGLCDTSYDSPARMLHDLVSKGWAEDSFDRTENRFALIEPTATGIIVSSFETYDAACRAHALSTN